MPSGLGAAIYGLITVGALLSAESAARETYPETVGGVVIALVIYWFAHSYSDFASWRIEEGKALSFRDLGRTMGEQLPILFGAGIPLGALVLAWILGASLGTAVSIAIWTAAGTITALEIIAGIRAKQSGRDLLLQIVVGALLGLLMIALRLVLH